MKFFAILVLLLPMTIFGQTFKSFTENDVPDDRYIVHTNGTVTDKQTGLMWKQCLVGVSGPNCEIGLASTPHDFHDATNKTSDINFAGYTDWRLPNINELISLIASDREDPSINLTIFPNTPSMIIMSSTPTKNGQHNNFRVDFNLGRFSPNESYWNYFMRVVRN